MRLRTSLVLLPFSLLLAFATAASAAVAPFDKPIYINAVPVKLPASPVLTQDRVLVPMRAYVESMGGEISWQPPNRVTAEVNGRTIALTLGSSTVQVAGQPATWNPAPQLIGDLTYVPLRALSEGVGAEVTYDGSAIHVTARKKTELVVFDGPLNIRALPALTAPILTTVPAGTRLEVLYTGTEWSQVALPRGGTGWTATRFTEPAPEIPSLDRWQAMLAGQTGYLQIQGRCIGTVPLIGDRLHAPVRQLLTQLGLRELPVLADPPVLIGGEPFVPVRPLAERLGLEYTWNGTTRVGHLGAAPAGALACNPISPAGAYLIMDAGTGLVLSEQRADQQRLVASTTKIMSALLSLERGRMEQMVTVSRTAAAMDGSRLGLRTGQRMKLGDLLYGLMLRSGNDAAVAIAEHLSGNEAAFAQAMTARAAELGATRTTFLNASGLDDDHRPLSTARDMAVITRHALQDAEFRALAAAQYHTIAGVARLENRNEFLFRYSNATGVKNGWTPAAGHTLVTSAYQDGRELILVILGATTREQLYAEAVRLMDHGFRLHDQAWLLQAGRRSPLFHPGL